PDAVMELTRFVGDQRLVELSTRDLDYHQVRAQLRSEAVPFPAQTPYDTNGSLKATFLAGFNRGWDMMLAGRFGNTIDVPPEYQKTAQLTEAWTNGCYRGTAAAVMRAIEKSGGKLPSLKGQTNSANTVHDAGSN